MNAPARRVTLAVDSPVPDALLNAQSDDALMVLTRDVRGPFDILVRRHQARVLRIAMRYLSDASLAQDVAQCAFLELYRGRHQYEARGKFTSYLWRVVINQCRMAARSTRRGAGSRYDVFSERFEPFLACENGRDLQRALSRLSEKLRVVVVLRYGADLDLAEIAEVLSVPLGTVKRRLFDAMAQLRVNMGES